jgi:hypothetical protein
MRVAAVLPYESTPVVGAIKKLYGIVTAVDQYIDELIGEMKSNLNSTISRTGRILEGAKYGFGIGYVVPVAIIALGQYLLGNSLGAVATVGGAVLLTNPIATTSAAIGAIYYGWQALTIEERNRILAELAQGLGLGAELLRALVRYVIDESDKLLSRKNFAEIKSFMAESAEGVGKTFMEIGQAIADGATGAVEFLTVQIRRIPTPALRKAKPPRRLVIAKKNLLVSRKVTTRRD